MEQTSLIIKYSSEYQIEMIFEKMIFDKISQIEDYIDNKFQEESDLTFDIIEVVRFRTR